MNVERIAAEDLPEVVEQARRGARERVRAILEERLVEAMLAGLQRPAAAPREGSGWWAYCVLPAGSAAELPGELTGVEDAPVEVIEHAGLAALASEVPLADFDDDALRDHLEDIRWVERVARAHQSVIEAAVQAGPAVPLRLCTIYVDRARVEATLADDAPRFTSILERVRGRCELGVKVFASQPVPPAEEEEQPAPSGSAYLEGRARRRATREQKRQAAAAGASFLHERLAAIAEEARANPVQAPEAHGRPGEMLLNGAYLVDVEGWEQFEAVVEHLREEHPELELELTGPWPPYNFAGDP